MFKYKKNKIIFIVIILIEIILGYVTISNINDSYYLEYDTTTATITYVGHSGKRPVKSGASYYMYFLIEYSDNNNIKYNNEITCHNFHKILKEGQTISIKYNPQNPREVIYPVYEEYLLENKKNKATIIFIITLITTIIVFFFKAIN